MLSPELPSSRQALTAAVVLASAGRPDQLRQVIEDLRKQEGVTFRAVVSVPDATSLPVDADAIAGWEVVQGTRGLAAQRNAALLTLTGVDIVFFFDDDAVVRGDYLRNALTLFDEHPGIVGLTGRVLLDGANSAEVPVEVATQALARSREEQLTGGWSDSRTLYGCNFAFRRTAARDIRFDARLPLYSWLEDHDFARRLLRIGTLARAHDCVIVHRAVASGGRQAHTRLGYSQVMNPHYLMRKGSFPVWLAAWETFRPVAKNLALAVAGPDTGRRRERAKGNLLAIADIVGGRVTPERITEL